MTQHQAYAAGVHELDEWMALVQLVRDSFPGLEDPAEMENHRRIVEKNMRRGTALCVRCKGRITGILLFSPKQMCLSFMAVHPEHRCKGVGSALVKAMLEQVPEGDIRVETFREDDPLGTAPHALYEKFGFRPAESVEAFGYPVQVFVLRR